MSTRIKTDSPSFVDFGNDIEKALQRAVRQALLMHKRIGNPVAVWRDGRVVIIPPEEIVIPPDDSETEK